MGQKFPKGHLKKLVVSEAGPPDACWLWPGHVNRTGYGMVGVDRKMQLAHRVAYAHRHGPILDGLVIDHICRQRSCFNPEHLEAVTPAVNRQRAVCKPRSPLNYPRGYLKALVMSEAGAPDECWLWPGTVHPSGYGMVRFGERMVAAHRASYETHYSNIAEGLQVDHLCHQRSCFNYRHLRAVSRVENMHNMQRRKDNTSGHPGVIWRSERNKWCVRISRDGKALFLGYFDNKEEAVKVAKEARRQAGYTY